MIFAVLELWLCLIVALTLGCKLASFYHFIGVCSSIVNGVRRPSTAKVYARRRLAYAVGDARTNIQQCQIFETVSRVCNACDRVSENVTWLFSLLFSSDCALWLVVGASSGRGHCLENKPRGRRFFMPATLPGQFHDSLAQCRFQFGPSSITCNKTSVSPRA